MRYCKRCVEPDTRPYMKFDQNGVCYPCLHYENRKNVDWKKRRKELETLADKYRGCNGDYYDCIITVSGGKDSWYQVHVFKEELHMNPLLVMVDNYNWTQTGRRNLDVLSERYGCDVVKISINRKVAKILMRKAFEKELIPTWYWDKTLYAFPLQIAIKLGIPLIIYGENTNYERGGPVDEDTPDALIQLRNDVVKPIDWSYWLGDGITMKDLQPAIYPSITEIQKAKIQSIFLSYYVPWSTSANVELAKKNGWKDLKDTGEWDREGLDLIPWQQIDTVGYLVHTWCKFVKFGHWVITDYASVLIREGKLTREQAVEIVNEQEYKLDRKMLKDFIDFIGYSEENFWKVVDKFANKKYVKKVDDKKNPYRLVEPCH